jgi:hypothetical protein
MVARVTVGFAPEHTPMRDRVILHAEPTPGWNRTPPTAPAEKSAAPPPEQ